MNSIKKVFKIIALGAVVVATAAWGRLFGEKETDMTGVFGVDDTRADVPAVAEGVPSGESAAAAEACGPGTACGAEGG